jgi:hypothetical protein
MGSPPEKHAKQNGPNGQKIEDIWDVSGHKPVEYMDQLSGEALLAIREPEARCGLLKYYYATALVSVLSSRVSRHISRL